MESLKKMEAEKNKEKVFCLQRMLTQFKTFNGFMREMNEKIFQHMNPFSLNLDLC
jgi:hypothetical protein